MGDNQEVFNFTVATGHDAKLKLQPEEGLTHDWNIYVKGAKGTRLDLVVRQVEFKLHESFPDPVRTIRTADSSGAYKVGESGYAGFLVPIKVTFMNGFCIELKHDLFLYNTRDVSSTTEHSLTFANPTPEFRKALLQSGAEVKPKSPPKSPPLLSEKTPKELKKPKYDEARRKERVESSQKADRTTERSDRDRGSKDERRKKKKREKEERKKSDKSSKEQKSAKEIDNLFDSGNSRPQTKPVIKSEEPPPRVERKDKKIDKEKRDKKIRLEEKQRSLEDKSKKKRDKDRDKDREKERDRKERDKKEKKIKEEPKIIKKEPSKDYMAETSKEILKKIPKKEPLEIDKKTEKRKERSDDEKRQREKRKSEKHPSLPEAKKRKSEKHSGLPPENKIEPKIEPDYDQTDEAPRLDRETKDTESEKRRKKDREKRKKEKKEKHEDKARAREPIKLKIPIKTEPVELKKKVKESKKETESKGSLGQRRESDIAPKRENELKREYHEPKIEKTKSNKRALPIPGKDLPISNLSSQSSPATTADLSPAFPTRSPSLATSIPTDPPGTDFTPSQPTSPIDSTENWVTDEDSRMSHSGSHREAGPLSQSKPDDLPAPIFPEESDSGSHSTDDSSSTDSSGGDSSGDTSDNDSDSGKFEEISQDELQQIQRQIMDYLKSSDSKYDKVLANIFNYIFEKEENKLNLDENSCKFDLTSLQARTQSKIKNFLSNISS